MTYFNSSWRAQHGQLHKAAYFRQTQTSSYSKYLAILFVSHRSMQWMYVYFEEMLVEVADTFAHMCMYSLLHEHPMGKLLSIQH